MSSSQTPFLHLNTFSDPSPTSLTPAPTLQVPNESLTPEQLQRREVGLSQLHKIKQMLFPSNNPAAVPGQGPPLPGQGPPHAGQDPNQPPAASGPGTPQALMPAPNPPLDGDPNAIPPLQDHNIPQLV